jgi:hypothetical protein
MKNDIYAFSIRKFVSGYTKRCDDVSVSEIQSAKQPTGMGPWQGSASLPDALDLPHDGYNPRINRRASEAVVQAAGFQT